MTLNAIECSILHSLTTIRNRLWAVLPMEDAASASICIARGWRVGAFVGLRGALEAIMRVLADVVGGYDLYVLCRDTALRCPVA